MTDRKKPGVAFWATVGLVAGLILYPLSYGPWFGMVQRGLISEQLRLATAPVYVPVEWIINNSSERVRDTIFRYLNLWTP